MSKLNLNPMADWGYVNNSRFRFLSIRNQGGGDSPVPPEPVFPTDRILYTVIEGGTQPTSTWITENCSDNVFDAETGEGYLVLNEEVTKILMGWYDGNNIATVVIPSQITSIGNNAFRGCTGLTSVMIPNSVTSIGDYAFKGCTGLTSVTIPNSVTSIGEYAFSGAGLTSIKIPNGVTSIRDGVFYLTTGLTSVTIPSFVATIGYNAFNGCVSLAFVESMPTIPPALGINAFKNIGTNECSVPFESLTAYNESWSEAFEIFVPVK